MNPIDQIKLINETDWSVLIILDACRYDSFEVALYTTNINGKIVLVSTHSRNTDEWYFGNWNQLHKDKILITANPHSKVVKVHSNFFKVVELWDDPNWLEPKTALEVLVDLQQEHPNKKFVVHLIPPHLPYIGKEGKKFLEKIKVERENIYATVQNYGRENGWKKPREYYQESLEEALSQIESFLPKIRGKIVISSDHGEFIGEDGMYNHNYADDLIFNVPWFEVKNDST